MAPQNRRQDTAPGSVPVVFDRAHLAHYTMHSADLEREIIGLFLLQLPMTIEMIEAADTAEEWRLSTHTLKGAAAAVGARRLLDVSTALENTTFNCDANVKTSLLGKLRAAADEFRQTVGHIYP